MISFEKITSALRPGMQQALLENRKGCEYSFTNMRIWGRQQAAKVDDFWVIFAQFDRKAVYPYPVGKGDVRPVLEAIIQDAQQRGIPCCITGLNRENVQTLDVEQVCRGIFSLSALAFVAGGMNVLYQVEQLPLMVAILIHGGVLYIAYLATYLLNGWLEWGAAPILVFTGIFVLGYLAIWVAIYSINRKTTEKLNKLLQQQPISENL